MGYSDTKCSKGKKGSRMSRFTQRYRTRGSMCIDNATPIRVEVIEAIRVFESEAINFATRFIKDGKLRVKYVSQVNKYSKAILESVRSLELSAAEAAGLAVSMRNQVLEATRLQSSDIGKAVAEQLKAKGLLLEQLQDLYAQKIYKKQFSALTKIEADRVFLEIVESSGRANPRVTSRAITLRRLGKGLLVVTVAVSVYNVATAADWLEAIAEEGVGLTGGFLGGAGGGAAAGLACGPGAPVCVTIGVFVGGVIGAVGADLVYDWFTED